MRVAMASSPGHGRPNEDFVGAVPDALVLLDGAGIPNTEDVCRHGVAWYSHRLGAGLLDRLSRDPASDLVTALADGIHQLTAEHRGSCDVRDPSSPQATVAVVRVDEDRVDFLVLADSYVVLDRPGADPDAVTDPREVDVRRECTAALDSLVAGTPEHDRALGTAVEAFRARRNRPDGYWIAKDDPAAAAQAVTGSVARSDLAGAALLSNGASRLVDPYGLADWPAVVDCLRTSGPDELVRRVRRAEATFDRGHSWGSLRGPDDATAAYASLA